MALYIFCRHVKAKEKRRLYKGKSQTEFEIVKKHVRLSVYFVGPLKAPQRDAEFPRPMFSFS